MYYTAVNCHSLDLRVTISDGLRRVTTITDRELQAARDRADWVRWVIATNPSTDTAEGTGRRSDRAARVEGRARRRRAPRRRAHPVREREDGVGTGDLNRPTVMQFVELPVRAWRANVYIENDGPYMTMYAANDRHAPRRRDINHRAVSSPATGVVTCRHMPQLIPAGMESDSGDSSISWPM